MKREEVPLDPRATRPSQPSGGPAFNRTSAQATPPPPTQSPSDRPADVVAVAIIRHAEQPQLLAAQRAYPSSLKGKWELPGGKVEPGEDYQQALAREIQEELACEIRLSQQVLNPDREDGAWPILQGRRMFVWLGTALDEPQVGADHLAVKWCAESDYRDLDWLAPNYPIVQAVWRLIAETTPSQFGDI